MAKERIIQSVAEQRANRTDVQLAGKYFISATEQCPASVIGQGVCVAMYCKETGKDPLILGKALANDEKKLHGLSVAANIRHRQLGVITTEPITAASIKPFVAGVFRYAAKAIYLEMPDLLMAANEFYTAFNPPDLSSDQRIYASRDYDEAIELLLFRKAQREAALLSSFPASEDAG